VLSKRVFADADGEDLEDIVTRTDQEVVADQLLKVIREYKNQQQEKCRIVASIAGGRKSMSALMYAAMSLGADADDIITHVLADEKASFCPNFFFPGQEQQHLTARINNQECRFIAAESHIDLAEIPFVPLSMLAEKAGISSDGSFFKLVTRMREMVMQQKPVSIRVSRSECVVYINNEALYLNHDTYLIMAILAHQGRNWLHTKDDSFRIMTTKLASQLYMQLRNEKLPREIDIMEERGFQLYHDLEDLRKEFEERCKNMDAKCSDFNFPTSYSKAKTHLKKSLIAGGFSDVAEDLIKNDRKKEAFNFQYINDIAFCK
jgi:hypothetical protein